VSRALPLMLVLIGLGVAAELLLGPTGFGWPASPFVLYELRFPRLMVALASGASLALCGIILQTVVRNPLASPYTLGVGSGAALGAAVAMLLAGVHPGFGALVGALLITSLLLGLLGRGDLDSNRLLLAGVTLSLSAGAGVLLLHFLVDRAVSQAMLHWSMGSLATVGMQSGWVAVAIALTGSAICLRLVPAMNQLQLGDALAASRGVAVARTQRILLVVAALWTGGVVAQVGPVGFVGLIAPHLARSLVGADLRRVTPIALLFGAGLLSLCDGIARVVMAPSELPVGILTALLGGPFFLLLMLRSKRH
jgi:iron complex transport system permease protein